MFFPPIMTNADVDGILFAVCSIFAEKRLNGGLLQKRKATHRAVAPLACNPFAQLRGARPIIFEQVRAFMLGACR